MHLQDTIGRRVAIDFFRHSAKHPTASMEECYDLADDADSLEQAYIKEERKIIVHKALQRLQPDYRQVLYLIYFEDFTNAEAAAVMKKSKRQIENLLYRAKASLKSELNKEGFLYEDL